MWPRLSFNRPLIWLGLCAMSAILWLPSVSLRLGAVVLMAVALWDGWRQIKLEQRRARLTEQVMRQSGEAVMITDAQHQIQAVNPAFTELSGYELTEVQGLSASNLAMVGLLLYLGNLSQAGPDGACSCSLPGLSPNA